MTAQLSREDVKAFIEDVEREMSQGWEARAFELKLAKHVLAGMDSEPVAWLIESEGVPAHLSSVKEYAQAYPDRTVTPLYAAPPAPVAVPDVIGIIERHAERLEKDGRAAEGFAEDQRKRYAAAMLRGVANECRATMQTEPVSQRYTLPAVAGKVLTITLPDTSSKAFWSSGGKSEIFHPETYKRWVKEAIERDCCIGRIEVKVK